MNVSDPHDAAPGQLLVRMAFTAIAVGNWPEAGEAADGGVALAHPVRPDVLAFGEAAAGIVAAIRGDAMTARTLLERSGRAATKREMSGLADVVQLGRGVEALSSWRYDEAWAQLRRLVDAESESAVWVKLVAIGYLVEAGMHCGDQRSADTDPTTVKALVELTSTPALHDAMAYVRAVSTGDVECDTAYERALSEFPPDRPFDRARLDLARGVWLRRKRRVSESRLPLHEALVTFERLGTTPWAEQARGELRATGARRIRHELGAVESLTPQERQIVTMAAAGMTNREIGQRLYLSHRTIGSHLYRVFPKLGVAARSQLRDVLAELPRPA